MVRLRWVATRASIAMVVASSLVGSGALAGTAGAAGVPAGPATAGASAPSGLSAGRVVDVPGTGSGPTAGTGTGVAPADAAALPSDPDGELTPLTPARIMDTRDGTGQAFPFPLVGGTPRDLQVTGVGGVPSTGVDAVVLNVTVTEPNAAGYLSVWPAGQTRPTISSVNFVPGQVVPNLVTVQIGTGGRVSLYTGFGATHVVVDVVGFYAAVGGPSGSRFHSTTPYRMLDTRTGQGAPIAPVVAGAPLALQVTGVGGVPSTGVTAVTLNVTVTNPTGSSVLTVYPSDVPRPLASNLNFTPGLTVANLVTVRVPANGVIDLAVLFGTTDVIADVAGYYDGTKTDEHGRFRALGPVRAVDTRDDNWPLGPGEGLFLNTSQLGDIDSLVINLTAVTPTSAGYLTVFPADVIEIPVASNLNFTPGQVVANQVDARLSDIAYPNLPANTFVVYNPMGDTHVVIDIFGYFT